MPAKATKTKIVAGRMVSAKSKTGDPACSAAMSTWVLGRKAGQVAAAVYAVLAKCRQKSAQNRKATLHQASGKLATGRGTWQRSDKAQALVAERAGQRAEQHRQQQQAQPSLRQQAAAHRATKGAREERIAAAVERAERLTGKVSKRHTDFAIQADVAKSSQTKKAQKEARQAEATAQRYAGRRDVLLGRSSALKAALPLRRQVAIHQARIGPPEVRQTAALFIREGRAVVKESGLKIKVKPDPNFEDLAGFGSLKGGIVFNPKSAHFSASGKNYVADPRERVYTSQSGKTPREIARLVMAHEAGHALEFTQMISTSGRPTPSYPEGVRKYNAMGKGGTISMYGRSHPGEMLAEIHALRMTGRKNEVPLDLARAYKEATSEGRLNRAAQLRAQHAAKIAAKAKPTPPVAAVKPDVAATVARAKEQAEGFGLKQESATGTKRTTFESTGGRTGTMFDMKKGDLPGQTSLLDRVATVKTLTTKAAGRHTLDRIAEAKRLRAERAKPKSSPSEQVAAHRATRGLSYPQRFDLAAQKKGERLRKRRADRQAKETAAGSKEGPLYTYGLHNRPPGPGSVPRGQVSRGKHPGFKHGTVSYDRPLTPKEIADYELESVHVPHVSAPAKTSLPTKAQLARHIPSISGGSPAALMERVDQVLARRKGTAAKLRTQRAELAEARRDPSTHTDHPAGHVGPLNTDLVHFDPARFQYKLAHSSETGSVGSLSGVKHYNPELAGTLQVWKDPADGKTYVVNGHNRLDLAKRHGAEKVAVRFLDSPNAADARAKGALTNIAEGRGTSLDAAKFFRDRTAPGQDFTRKDLEDAGIPLREKVATEGLALAQLHPTLFRHVIDGNISAERGAIYGGSGLKHHEQEALHKLAEGKGKAITNDHLRELAEEVRQAPTAKTTTHDLFGSNEEETSLALHKTKVQSEIKRRLATEKRLFGTVSKSKAATELARGGNVIDAERSGQISHEASTTLQAFDQLKHLKGPVSHALNEAAERIHAGESVKTVTDATYRRILHELPAFLRGNQAFAS